MLGGWQGLQIGKDDVGQNTVRKCLMASSDIHQTWSCFSAMSP